MKNDVAKNRQVFAPDTRHRHLCHRLDGHDAGEHRRAFKDVLRQVKVRGMRERSISDDFRARNPAQHLFEEAPRRQIAGRVKIGFHVGSQPPRDDESCAGLPRCQQLTIRADALCQSNGRDADGAKCIQRADSLTQAGIRPHRVAER